jgi:hypothetical protein
VVPLSCFIRLFTPFRDLISFLKHNIITIRCQRKEKEDEALRLNRVISPCLLGLLCYLIARNINYTFLTADGRSQEDMNLCQVRGQQDIKRNVDVFCGSNFMLSHHAIIHLTPISSNFVYLSFVSQIHKTTFGLVIILLHSNTSFNLAHPPTTVYMFSSVSFHLPNRQSLFIDKPSIRYN